MPRIPTYENTIGTVKQASRPDVHLRATATPDVFDGGMGGGADAVARGLNKAADQALNAYDKIQKKKDSIWVSESLAKLSQQYDQYTYGTPDGQTPGVLSTKGLAAADMARDANDNLDKMIADVAVEPTSDDALAEYKIRAMSVRSSHASTIARHAATELNNYHAEAKLGNAKIQSESIAADYNKDPDQVEKEFQERVAPDIVDGARLKGKPAEEALREAKAGLYSSIIKQSYVSGNTKRATELLDRWGDDLGHEARATLTHAIRTENTKLQADDMAEKYLGKLEAGGSFSSIMHEINGIEDRDLKVATRSAFRPLASQWRYDKAQADNEATVGATLKLDGLAGNLKAQFDAVNAMPDGKAKTHAMTRYKQYAAAEGRSFMTDPASFDALADKVKYADITDEKSLRGDPAAAKVAEHDLKFLAQDLGKKQGAKVGEMQEAYLRAQGGKTTKDPADRLAFLNFARENVTKTNRGDDPDYLQKLADQWFLKGEKKGGGFGYGADAERRKALKDPNWLPDIIEDEKVREGNVVALSKTSANEIIATAGQPGGVPAERWKKYMGEAGGDNRIAARMAWRDYLNSQTNKRTRGK